VLFQPAGHANHREFRIEGNETVYGFPSAFVAGIQVQENDVDRLIQRLAAEFSEGFVLVSSGNNAVVANFQNVAQRLAYH